MTACPIQGHRGPRAYPGGYWQNAGNNPGCVTHTSQESQIDLTYFLFKQFHPTYVSWTSAGVIPHRCFTESYNSRSLIRFNSNHSALLNPYMTSCPQAVFSQEMLQISHLEHLGERAHYDLTGDSISYNVSIPGGAVILEFSFSLFGVFVPLLHCNLAFYFSFFLSLHFLPVIVLFCINDAIMRHNTLIERALGWRCCERRYIKSILAVSSWSCIQWDANRLWGQTCTSPAGFSWCKSGNGKVKQTN